MIGRIKQMSIGLVVLLYLRLSTLYSHPLFRSTSMADNLFSFRLQPSGFPRNWRSVLHRQRFTARLLQDREPVAGDDVGQQITDA